jgi:transposase
MDILNSSSQRVFAGLDYHDQSVQVCVLDEAGRTLGNKSVGNDWQQVAACVPAGARVFAAIEACTGAAHLAEQLVERAGFSVSLAHPGIVSRMKQNRDKTDRTDAWVLGDLERVGYLPRVWLAPPELRELRRLVRYRHQLVRERRSVKLRIRALLRDHRIKLAIDATAWTKKWLEQLKQVELPLDSQWILQRHLVALERLEQELREIEERLQERVAGDAIVARLLKEKGIGLITAATMRAEIGRFDRFRDGKQLAHFCGLSPRNHSSGQRQADAGVSKTGNPDLRALLIEAAQRLIRFDERWMKLAIKMKSQGKHPCVIVAAVANRYMRRLFHELQPDNLAA